MAINWGKRPEFNPRVPLWRKRLDYVMLAIGLSITAYNAAYVILGTYYAEIDHESEKKSLRDLDDRLNTVLFGKTQREMSPLLRSVHDSVSVVTLVEQIKERERSSGEERKEEVVDAQGPTHATKRTESKSDLFARYGFTNKKGIAESLTE